MKRNKNALKTVYQYLVPDHTMNHFFWAQIYQLHGLHVVATFPGYTGCTANNCKWYILYHKHASIMSKIYPNF